MDLDGLEKVIGAGGVKSATGVRASDDFDDRVEEFLVDKYATINDKTEKFRDEFHLDVRIPSRFACFSQSFSS